jgi:hypothetical protein
MSSLEKLGQLKDRSTLEKKYEPLPPRETMPKELGQIANDRHDVQQQSEIVETKRTSHWNTCNTLLKCSPRPRLLEGSIETHKAKREKTYLVGT